MKKEDAKLTPDQILIHLVNYRGGIIRVDNKMYVVKIEEMDLRKKNFPEDEKVPVITVKSDHEERRIHI